MSTDFSEACETIKEVQADITGFAEHNLDLRKSHVHENITDTTHKLLPSSELILSDSPITMKSSYKPGGVMMIASKTIVARLCKSGNDSLGRWVYQTFSAHNNRHVTIITIYQVCKKHKSAQGLTTAASQQESLLIQKNHKTTNPRTAFRHDLSIFLRTLGDNNHELVIIGDFNET